MAFINYKVRAEVVDLLSDKPGPGDAFFVDTNVWYWLTYTRYRLAYKPRQPRPYQVRDYPAYIKQAKRAKARLFTCGLCFGELANLIEKNELDIFRMSKGQIEIKEFRHNEQTERNNVVTEIQDSWAMVKSFAGFIEVLLDEPLTDKACHGITSWPADPNDLFMVENSIKAGVSQIITDDGDFATVPGIRILTANRNVIQAAQDQGKLIVRS
jgi:predicted nucleic acid-binding protein